MRLRNNSSCSGSALVIALLLIVLLSVILLASFTSAQLSRQAARSRADSFYASQFAVMGTEQAVGLLRYATSSTNTFWVSQPGQITRFKLGTTEVEHVALSSGIDPGTNGINLNQPFIQNPSEGNISYAITNKMPSQWLYLRADGTIDKSNAFNSTNRIVGRYAYWVDDDSTKVNINTAWKNTAANTNALSHPSRVELSKSIQGLSDAEADKIASFRDTHGAFNSTQDLLRALADETNSFGDVLREAKFDLTHYNASPELTYFGQPKIVLTTQKRRATAPDGTVLPFLDVYANSNWGDGTVSGDIDQNKVNATVAMLVSYLSRSDWPMSPGQTFQDKFYNGNLDSLKQLALNIIEYVRLKETPPLSATSVPHQSAFVHLPNKYRAFTRSAFITEAGAWVSDATSGRIPFAFWCELYLPKNMGISEIDLDTLYTYETRPWEEVPPRHFDPSEYISNTGGEPKHILKAGEYAVLCIAGGAWDYQVNRPTIETPLRIFTAPVDGYFYLDSVPPAETASNPNSFPIPITRGVPNQMQNINTVSIDDPALNDRAENWHAAGNSLGAPNPTRTLATAPLNHALEQDLDHSGRITDASIVFPAPAGVIIPGSPSSNPNGIMESLAELGYIHTGVQPMGDGVDNMGVLPANNVPWRTLHLQPRYPSVGDSSLPDWALLDLFTLPFAANENRILYPSASSKGGRINLNAAIEPFTSLSREMPLNSSISGFTNFVNPGQTASNIVTRTLASGSFGKGRSYGDSNLLYFPSEIVEFAGVAADGEESEPNLRGFIDLLSTKSSVFSIVSIGQSLSQLPDGKIIIRSEARRRSMVERYEDDGVVKFRVILTRSQEF